MNAVQLKVFTSPKTLSLNLSLRSCLEVVFLLSILLRVVRSLERIRWNRYDVTNIKRIEVLG